MYIRCDHLCRTGISNSSQQRFTSGTNLGRIVSPLTTLPVALPRFQSNYIMVISKDISCPTLQFVIQPEDTRYYLTDERVTFVSFFEVCPATPSISRSDFNFLPSPIPVACLYDNCQFRHFVHDLRFHSKFSVWYSDKCLVETWLNLSSHYGDGWWLFDRGIELFHAEYRGITISIQDVPQVFVARSVIKKCNQKST